MCACCVCVYIKKEREMVAALLHMVALARTTVLPAPLFLALFRIHFFLPLIEILGKTFVFSDFLVCPTSMHCHVEQLIIRHPSHADSHTHTKLHSFDQD